MEPSTFGLQAGGAGGDLPEEWQALIASQASTLVGLLSRMQTAAVTLRRRQMLTARVQALAALTVSGMLLCSACALDTGEDMVARRGMVGGGVVLGLLALMAACSDGLLGCRTGDFRCNDNHVQICNANNSWENIQDCGSIGEFCSEAPASCSGLENFACCVRLGVRAQATALFLPPPFQPK